MFMFYDLAITAIEDIYLSPYQELMLLLEEDEEEEVFEEELRVPLLLSEEEEETESSSSSSLELEEVLLDDFLLCISIGRRVLFFVNLGSCFCWCGR